MEEMRRHKMTPAERVVAITGQLGEMHKSLGLERGHDTNH